MSRHITSDEIAHCPQIAASLINELQESIEKMDRTAREAALEDSEGKLITAMEQALIKIEEAQASLKHANAPTVSLALYDAGRILEAGLCGKDCTPQPCSICRSSHGQERTHSAE